MDKQNMDIAEIYKKYYDKYKKESICLNKDNWNTHDRFNFLQEVYSIGSISKTLCKSFKNDPKIFNLYKTEDCKIVIETVGEYIMFKMLINIFKRDIKLWKKQYSKKIDISSNDIKEKAIVDIVKKEIKFAQKNLKFKKGWFVHLK